MSTRRTSTTFLAALALLAAACEREGPPAPIAEAPSHGFSDAREPCAGRDPQRRPFFGDTHVHTAYSQDASTQGTRTTPRDAYRIARGERLPIQPWRPDGSALRTVQLDRPLDFAAVTDHAEQIGEVQICNTPGAAGHDSLVCRMYRGFPRVAFFVMNTAYSSGGERFGFCGEGGAGCLAAARTVWADTQAAADEAYDRSAACRFTSFVGYEWTAGVDRGKNLHRNVIFRNAHVPELPISTMETGPNAAALWTALDRECTRGVPGCEVLTIPHNSNLDGGLMFQSARAVGAEIGAEEARIRARWEPLVEVMQHKGDSECLASGDTTDEACGFEKLPYDNFGGRFPILGADPPRRIQFAREALKRGLSLEKRFGSNPFRFGLIASTDTHLGAPGLTSERDYPGHGGAGAAAASSRRACPMRSSSGPAASPCCGRRRTRATRSSRRWSGARPTARAGRAWWCASSEASTCRSECAATPTSPRRATRAGSPWAAPSTAGRGLARASPRSRCADPGTERDPGAPLQRIQVVKGWLAGETLHERVVDVAGGPNDAGVDLATCARRGAGHERLCSVWQDDDYRPDEPAFYYARVLENPSCRWSQLACNAAHVDCSRPETVGKGFEPCCAPEHQRTIQERAWTSPIWVDAR